MALEQALGHDLSHAAGQLNVVLFSLPGCAFCAEVREHYLKTARGGQAGSAHDCRGRNRSQRAIAGLERARRLASRVRQGQRRTVRAHRDVLRRRGPDARRAHRRSVARLLRRLSRAAHRHGEAGFARQRRRPALQKPLTATGNADDRSRRRSHHPLGAGICLRHRHRLRLRRAAHALLHDGCDGRPGRHRRRDAAAPLGRGRGDGHRRLQPHGRPGLGARRRQHLRRAARQLVLGAHGRPDVRRRHGAGVGLHRQEPDARRQRQPESRGRSADRGAGRLRHLERHHRRVARPPRSIRSSPASSRRKTCPRCSAPPSQCPRPVPPCCSAPCWAAACSRRRSGALHRATASSWRAASASACWSSPRGGCRACSATSTSTRRRSNRCSSPPTRTAWKRSASSPRRATASTTCCSSAMPRRR